VPGDRVRQTYSNLEQDLRHPVYAHGISGDRPATECIDSADPSPAPSSPLDLAAGPIDDIQSDTRAPHRPDAPLPID